VTAREPSLSVLSYDDLPPGSDLRREYRTTSAHERGTTVIITVPGGDVPAEIRRKESRAAMVRAAAVAAVLVLILGFAAFGVYRDNLRRLDPVLRLGAQVLAIAFTVCLFLLAWRIDRGARLDSLGKARRQSTVLHADRHELLVETAGPFGQASHRLAGNRIRGFAVARIVSHDAGLLLITLRWLVIHRNDGPSLHLLPGREAAEIQWVILSLQRALHAGDGSSPKLG
jgi:amino acid transporter